MKRELSMMDKSLGEDTNFCARDVDLNNKHRYHLNSTFRN